MENKDEAKTNILQTLSNWDQHPSRLASSSSPTQVDRSDVGPSYESPQTLETP